MRQIPVLVKGESGHTRAASSTAASHSLPISFGNGGETQSERSMGQRVGRLARGAEAASDLEKRLADAVPDETPRWQPTPDAQLARVVSVYDGDTVTLLASFGGSLGRCSMRLCGVDCPEMRGRGQAEREAAEAVRDVVRGQCLDRICKVHAQGMDKYGRLIGDVETPDGQLVARLLLSKGLARTYDGGTRSPFTDEELERIRLACAALSDAAPS